MIATSRAVLRPVEPAVKGLSEPCHHCRKLITWEPPMKRNGRRQHRVIANVYEGGSWVRVEHFHAQCYEDAGRPYGEAA